MNIEEIKKYLPHREPLLLVDQVVDLKSYKYIDAVKNVNISNFFFNGHFPNNPIMPGVLILECLAQAGAILAYKSGGYNTKTTLFYLGSVINLKFRKIVRPGDKLILKVKVKSIKLKAWRFIANAYVGLDMACFAEMICLRKDFND